MKKHSILLTPFLLLLASVAVNAQFTGSYGGAWGSTWNNPASSLASVMIQGYINKKMMERSIANQKGNSTGSTASSGSSKSVPSRSQNAPAPDYAVLRFKPVANSGVAKQTADALSENPQERAALLTIFQEIKKSYDAESAKSGTANNIAAALTFFMTAASMAYHQTDEPTESVTNGLVEILQEDMSAKPEFKSMTNLEKQKMHDWLVVSGGFILAGYLDAVQTSDAKQLADYKELANELYKLVLGPGIEKVNLAEIGATPVADEPAPQPEPASPQSAVPSTAGAMHATELVKEFDSNKVRAKQMYVGKRVRIYGTVNEIEIARDETIILTFNRSALTYSNAQCYFSKSQASRVASINSNDEVTVEGTVKGLGGGALGIKAFVVLENCVIP